jgi:hypothetical protein
MKKPTAVSHLLEQGEGMLKRLRAGATEAERALAALRLVLPPEIGCHVFSATLRGTTLTAFVPTAAWGTRLRYVAPKLTGELGAALGVAVEEIKVKVRAKPR